VISLLLELEVKMSASTVSSKGQVTIPQEVRNRLGLRPGDRVEWVEEGDQMIFRPARQQRNVFEKYIGVLPAFRNRDEINAWTRELREDDRSPE
jgi:AbrB family looped-hinge helix DNA binding protein